MPSRGRFQENSGACTRQKNIGVGTGLQHADIPIKLSIFLPKPKSSKKSNIKIKVSDGSADFPSEMEIRISQKYRVMELVDGSSQSKTICVCRMDSILRCTILGTHPKYEAQDPSPVHSAGDKKKLYKWFIANRTSKNNRNVKLFPIEAPSPGKQKATEAEYHCEEVMPHLQYGQVVIRKKCAPAVLLRQLRQPYHDDTNQDLTIAPGMDPCLSLCIAVIVNAFDYFDSRFDWCECFLDCLGSALCSGF